MFESPHKSLSAFAVCQWALDEVGRALKPQPPGQF